MGWFGRKKLRGLCIRRGFEAVGEAWSFSFVPLLLLVPPLLLWLLLLDRHDVLVVKAGRVGLVGVGVAAVGVKADVVGSVCPSSLRPPDDEDEDRTDLRTILFQVSRMAILFCLCVLCVVLFC